MANQDMESYLNVTGRRGLPGVFFSFQFPGVTGTGRLSDDIDSALPKALDYLDTYRPTKVSVYSRAGPGETEIQKEYIERLRGNLREARPEIEVI